MGDDENRSATQPSSKIINLNVGGTVFATSRETLAAAGDSFFSSLISEHFKQQRDQNNNLFIDRDPKLFASVLNFLRSQCTYLSVDKCNRAKLQSLLAEAEFYAVVPLMEEVQRQLDELDEEDKKREAERSRKKIHKAFAPSRPSRQSSQSSDTSTETPPAAPDAEGQREEEEDEADGEGLESTPLTQGRYVERTHAGLISDAARHMDMDF